MKLSMFLEFPGILIVIGLVLITISIIIGIFSSKKEVVKEENMDNLENEYDVKPMKLVDDEEVKEKIISEVDLIKDNVIPTPIDDEIVLEDTTDVIEQKEDDDFLDTKEYVVLNEEEKQQADVETL
ncbi:MAG: hypothetical protein PUC23_02100 [bacterium]|nr:hypothetical protein [bacterium]